MRARVRHVDGGVAGGFTKGAFVILRFVVGITGGGGGDQLSRVVEGGRDVSVDGRLVARVTVGGCGVLECTHCVFVRQLR